MVTWECPDCRRRFGHRNQSHVCAPALSEAEYFATGPVERERPVFEAVRDHLEGIGPVIIEFVQVGIFFKRVRTFVELRPQTKRIMMSVLLPRVVRDERISRTLTASGLRTLHYVPLVSPAEVDDAVRGWLTESYLDSPI